MKGQAPAPGCLVPHLTARDWLAAQLSHALCVSGTSSAQWGRDEWSLQSTGMMSKHATVDAALRTVPGTECT